MKKLTTIVLFLMLFTSNTNAGFVTFVQATGADLTVFSKELLEDPEFNYAADDIKNVDIKEIDVDYDKYVENLNKH